MKKFAIEIEIKDRWVRLHKYSNLTETKANFLYRLCEMTSDAFKNHKNKRVAEQNEEL